MRKTDPDFQLMVVEAEIKDLETILKALKSRRLRLKSLITRNERNQRISYGEAYMSRRR